MKKILFLFASVCLATTGFARKYVGGEKVPVKDKATYEVSSVYEAEASQLTTREAVSAEGPQRAYADGVYYQTPTGSLWITSQRPQYVMGAPCHVVAPMTEFTYKNKSTQKNGQWTTVTSSSTIDLTKYTDADNNLVYSYGGGYGAYYGPTYTESEISYIPTTSSGKTMVNYVDELDNVTFFANNVGARKLYNGGSLLPLKNLYGAGTINDVASSGFIYTTPKPMSPLYVEEVWCWATDKEGANDPLHGKTLKLQIFDHNDASATEPLFTLTCTPEQCVYDRDGFFVLHFTQKQEDPISGETVDAPFVLDCSAEMYFTGFDQEGVTAGVMGCAPVDEFRSTDKYINQTYFMVGDKLSYYTNTVAYVGFTAFFDKIEVWEEEIIDEQGTAALLNGMLVSADGQTCQNNVIAACKGAFVDAALDWDVVDSEGTPTGEENYWSDDMADYEWIQSLTHVASENYACNYEVGVVCEALPEGVTKRFARIHLNGKGAQSGEIYVFQGDYTTDEMQQIMYGTPTQMYMRNQNTSWAGDKMEEAEDSRVSCRHFVLKKYVESNRGNGTIFNFAIESGKGGNDCWGPSVETYVKAGDEVTDFGNYGDKCYVFQNQTGYIQVDIYCTKDGNKVVFSDWTMEGMADK
ncbi:MAG: hypothetical protein HUK03_09115, partial [Bacteroidaceae bacterium]|nr:hypothetical protein [Bacteroidaceae bacterium]